MIITFSGTNLLCIMQEISPSIFIYFDLGFFHDILKCIVVLTCILIEPKLTVNCTYWYQAISSHSVHYQISYIILIHMSSFSMTFSWFKYIRKLTQWPQSD